MSSEGGAAKFLSGLPSRGNFSSISASSTLVRTPNPWLKPPQMMYFFFNFPFGVKILVEFSWRVRGFWDEFLWLWSAQGRLRVYVCEHDTDPPGQWEIHSCRDFVVVCCISVNSECSILLAS
jgi:hypothetical protein